MAVDDGRAWAPGDAAILHDSIGEHRPVLVTVDAVHVVDGEQRVVVVVAPGQNCSFGAALASLSELSRPRYSAATIAEMQRRQVAAGFPPFADDVVAEVQLRGPRPPAGPAPA